jgi:hypothetical protein
MRAGKGYVESIGFDPIEGRLRSLRFRSCALQHGVGEIGTKDLRGGLPCLAAQSERHIAGPATQVENTGIRTPQDVPKTAGGAAPPHAVYVAGKHVVQKIVTGRDGGKHVAHGAGCGLLITRACGSGPDNA